MVVGEYIPSTQDVSLDDIAHIIIPGRGRSVDGMDLSTISATRVDAAAAFYADLRIAEKSGVIICTGYKTPADQNGEPWSDGQETFQGRPEAYSMQARLVGHGIDPSRIVIEPHSVDTATNFAYSRRKLPDTRPFGIASQREHLDRMMSVITPRLFRQAHVGLVVPDLSDEVDHDNLFARTASWLSVVGLTPDASDERIALRSERVWGTVLLPQHAKIAAISLTRRAQQQKTH